MWYTKECQGGLEPRTELLKHPRTLAFDVYTCVHAGKVTSSVKRSVYLPSEVPQLHLTALF